MIKLKGIQMAGMTSRNLYALYFDSVKCRFYLSFGNKQKILYSQSTSHR